jgi:hypothetical protein
MIVHSYGPFLIGINGTAARYLPECTVPAKIGTDAIYLRARVFLVSPTGITGSHGTIPKTAATGDLACDGDIAEGSGTEAPSLIIQPCISIG